MSLIQDSYTAIEENGVNLASQYGWTTSPFIVFCKTIPGRFYPIGMLFLQVHPILFFFLFVVCWGTGGLNCCTALL